MQNYHDEYGRFPPAYTVDAEGRPLHSWRTLLLPYLHERELYERLDLTKPWDDPVNVKLYPPSLPTYRCPWQRIDSTFTTYLAVMTPQSALRPGESCKLRDITDGPTNTLLVIEAGADHAVPWMAPRDADERLILGINQQAKLPHQGVWHGLLADGTTPALSAQLPSDTRRSLLTIAGNDTPQP